MDRDEKNQIALKVLAETLEQFAFVFGDPADPRLADGDNPMVRVKMEFKGDLSGAFFLFAPKSSCPEIAANILGMEAGDLPDPESPIDGVKELLNIVGSHILTGIGGEEREFNITIPEVLECRKPDWIHAANDPDTVAMASECGLIALQVKIFKEGDGTVWM